MKRLMGDTSHNEASVGQRRRIVEVRFLATRCRHYAGSCVNLQGCYNINYVIDRRGAQSGAGIVTKTGLVWLLHF